MIFFILNYNIQVSFFKKKKSSVKTLRRQTIVLKKKVASTISTSLPPLWRQHDIMCNHKSDTQVQIKSFSAVLLKQAFYT